MKNILFKVPYDFQYNTINKYEDIIIKYPFIKINTIYLPAFKDHCRSARDDTNAPNDWEEYSSHVLYLQNRGYDVEILIQEPGIFLNKEILYKYIFELNCRNFTVYEDRNANMIKSIDPNIHVTASITKLLSPSDIINIPEYLYDEICLFYFYNRNIDLIKKLPKKFKYSIIPNASCNTLCKSCTDHWFNFNINRRSFNCKEDRLKYNSKILDLLYFFDCIDIFKIQNREDIDIALIHLNKYGEIISSEKIFNSEEYYNLSLEFPIYSKERINNIGFGIKDSLNGIKQDNSEIDEKIIY